jgi:hypothetical protein
MERWRETSSSQASFGALERERLQAAKNLEAGKEIDIATGKVVEDEVR